MLHRTTANIRHEDLWRYAAQDVESQRRKPGGFLLELGRDGTTSIHKQVLDFLTAGKYKWDVDDAVVTVQDLLLAGVITNMHENMQTYVLPKEVYPAYDYVQLNAANLSLLVEEKTFNEKEYISDTQNLCTCSEEEYISDTQNLCTYRLHVRI